MQPRGFCVDLLHGPQWMRSCHMAVSCLFLGHGWPHKALKEPLSTLWLFLICFQARGAPREGQGDAGAMRRPEYPKNTPKPLGNL